MANIADQVCPYPSLLILETGSGGGVVVLTHLSLYTKVTILKFK
jgi:hypothetical protein